MESIHIVFSVRREVRNGNNRFDVTSVLTILHARAGPGFVGTGTCNDFSRSEVSHSQCRDQIIAEGRGRSCGHGSYRGIHGRIFRSRFVEGQESIDCHFLLFWHHGFGLCEGYIAVVGRGVTGKLQGGVGLIRDEERRDRLSRASTTACKVLRRTEERRRWKAHEVRHSALCRCHVRNWML